MRKKILIVDNASTDETSLLALDYKETQNQKNIEVIRNKTNLGYGGSQKLAYQRAIEKGYDAVAMLHGDAQYAPEYLENLLNPILQGEADMIFGSRIAGDPLKGGMPWIRYLGNRFLTGLQNRLTGASLTEYHSGYRVYSTEALKKLNFESLSSDYHFDTEIIILFIEENLRIKEIPIPTHYGDEDCHVNIWKYGMDVVVTTLSYFLYRKGVYHSKNWSRILKDAKNHAQSKH